MELVINEWLPEYLRPDESEQKKILAGEFLNTFMNQDDLIVIRQPSPFLNRIIKYQKQFNYDNDARDNYKKFIKFILLDSNKCRFVEDDEFDELPAETLEKLSQGNYGSDKYLFEAAMNSENKIILTTDGRLITHMNSDENFEVILLEDFLENYSEIIISRETRKKYYWRVVERKKGRNFCPFYEYISD